MKFSIICTYNNKDVLNEYLIPSLKKQQEEYELILIDNTDKKFNSAAEALNFGGNNANGDLLIFVHQDIMFYDNNLTDISSYCENLENMGIAGVLGVSKKNNGRPLSNIYSGIPPKRAFEEEIKNIEYAQTLDELLLIIPKNIFKKYKFDAETCYDWHLYGADYCLNVKKNGYEVLILPITLYHISTGESMSLEYFKTLKNILKKYEGDFDRIYTTCLLSHNPHNLFKLNVLYVLEVFHIRMPLMNFLASFSFLKRIFK